MKIKKPDIAGFFRAAFIRTYRTMRLCDVRDVLVFGGLSLVSAGMYLQFGLPFALLTPGVALIVIGLVWG